MISRDEVRKVNISPCEIKFSVESRDTIIPYLPALSSHCGSSNPCSPSLLGSIVRARIFRFSCIVESVVSICVMNCPQRALYGAKSYFEIKEIAYLRMCVKATLKAGFLLGTLRYWKYLECQLIAQTVEPEYNCTMPLRRKKAGTVHLPLQFNNFEKTQSIISQFSSFQ